MEIIQYQEKYKQDFINLTTAWIEKYFVMEPADHDTLYHVEKYMEKGGMIFFAVENGRVLATCMTYPHDDAVWELTKLGTCEEFQRCGAGTAVFKACMDYAARHGAKKLMLETNHILRPALHIYEKLGFYPVPLDPNSQYERADVRMEYAVPDKVRSAD